MNEEHLHERLATFVRRFGLLDPNQTPCGQPIPTSQAHGLQAIGHTPGLTQQMLAAQLNLDKSTTSRLVGQLVERDWVDRSVNPQNRREAQLTLTPAGQKVYETVTAAALARSRAIWTRLDPAKRAQVLEALDLLQATLTEE